MKLPLLPPIWLTEFTREEKLAEVDAIESILSFSSPFACRLLESSELSIELSPQQIQFNSKDTAILNSETTGEFKP